MTNNEFDRSQGSDPQADAAFDQLRSQDPAAGVNPNLPHLWENVDARVRATDGGPVPVTDIQDARSVRRSNGRRWSLAAAAAVGAVAIGFGGYAIGNNTAGDAKDVAAAPAAAPAEVPAKEPVAEEVPPVEAPLDAPVEADPGMMGMPEQADERGGMAAEGKIAADSYMGGYGGRTEFSAGDGLGTEGGTAKAWGLDAAGVVTAEKAAELAASFGITGEPRLEYGSWSVGPVDGTGPYLSLSPDGSAGLNYYNPLIDPYYCPMPTEIVDDGSAGIAVENCEPDLDQVAPQGDEAIAAAKDVLAGMGVEVDGLDFTTEEYGDSPYSYVTAKLIVDGVTTDLSWGVTLVEEGVQSVYGGLASVVDLGEYAVISPAEAVERMADSRFGYVNLGNPVLFNDLARTEPAIEEPTEPTEPTVPPTPAAGGSFAWPVQQVTITGAELGTSVQYLDNGSTVLLPTYTLSDAEGNQWSVLALTEAALDFTAGS